MSKYKGRELRIKVRTSTGPDVFTVIGGIRTESMTINNETVDVTDKDGNGWRELLEGAGITSMSLKGSGVVSDDTVFTDHIMAAVMANTHVVLKIESGLGDVWQGTFAVPSAERAGEYNKEETFSITLESAGTITYTAV
ncbi:MAG TPA: phage major tail protein, TP901-1 family [Agitococcus sp.]|nr:phage major tail protein, TP901-1 family [Agitococcus sp.]